MKKVGPWVDVAGGAYRALAGTDGKKVENRVAFIEKTPRIRIRRGSSFPHEDYMNWAERPFKGEGPQDAKSRQWCDEALRHFGYELEEDARDDAEALAAKNDEPSVTLKLYTHEQAYAVRDALDLYSRVCMGQLDVLADLVKYEQIPLGPQRKYLESNEVADTVRPSLAGVKSSLGYPSTSFHWGISHDAVPIAAKRAYEVERVLTKALANARNPSPVFRGTDYDGLVVRYTSDPVPAVRAPRRRFSE